MVAWCEVCHSAAIPLFVNGGMRKDEKGTRSVLQA
jgi:hypothetical protein